MFIAFVRSVVPTVLFSAVIASAPGLVLGGISEMACEAKLAREAEQYREVPELSSCDSKVDDMVKLFWALAAIPTFLFCFTRQLEASEK